MSNITKVEFNGFIIEANDKVFYFRNSNLSYTKNFGHDIGGAYTDFDVNMVANYKDKSYYFHFMKYMQGVQKHKKIIIFNDNWIIKCVGVYIKELSLTKMELSLNLDYSIEKINDPIYMRKYKIKKLMENV